MNINPVLIAPVSKVNSSLVQTIQEIKKYIQAILVIYYGSEHNTYEALATIPEITILTFAEKKRNNIIRKGLKEARRLGYSHVIIFNYEEFNAEDIPGFIDDILSEPETIWVGTPERSDHKSSFINNLEKKLLSQIFNWTAGKRLEDPLCSFRSYPIEPTSKLKIGGSDFETKLLLTAAINDITVQNRNVTQKRDTIQGGAGISAVFRIFSEFIYFIPGIYQCTAPGKRKDGIIRKIISLIRKELNSNTTPFKASLSLALGIFLAITPFHGLQVLSIFALSFILKLNRPLALLGVSISPAPLLPLWIAASIGTGKLFLPDTLAERLKEGFQRFLPEQFFQWFQTQTHIDLLPGFVHYILGSLILAFTCGLGSFIGLYCLFSATRKSKLNKPNQPQ